MRMPVDFAAVMKAAADMDVAAAMELSLAVYVDETAQDDLAAHVRAAFAGAGAGSAAAAGGAAWGGAGEEPCMPARVRVTMSYFGEELAQPRSEDDMAVVVAGFSERAGEQAELARRAGVPAMVVTVMPNLVSEMAEAFGCPVPEGDLVFPERRAGGFAARVFGGEAGGAGADAASGGGAAAEEPVEERTGASPEEPIVLDAAALAALDMRMGEWVVAACHEKRLAFALAFPCVRRPLSLDSVNATSLQNAGIGAVLFIPGADMPVMTLNQAKMLLQIAAAYGKPMTGERAKELACVVGGAFACRAVARQAAGLVPALGWAVKAGVGYAGTLAMGKAAIEYFEAGGDAAGLANVVGKACNEAAVAAQAAAETPAGRKVLQLAREGLVFAADAVARGARSL